MTVVHTYSCDYCNPEQNPDHDEGFVRTEGTASPLGWWEVPGKAENGGMGHACPHCVMFSKAAKDDIIERRDAETLRLTGGGSVED